MRPDITIRDLWNIISSIISMPFYLNKSVFAIWLGRWDVFSKSDAFASQCTCNNIRSCEMRVGSGNVWDPPLGTSLGVPGCFYIKFVE